MSEAPESITGSYDPDDVTFLLKQVNIEPTEVGEKERLIQTGAAHYSEMISKERRPDSRYISIYREAMDRHDGRVAREVAAIAQYIMGEVETGRLPGEITICSLLRAGVPYGVLLRRALIHLGIDNLHFAVSIVRDRGLDRVAMEYVLRRRDPNGILFVDGWTGKGAISNELSRAWRALQNTQPNFLVLADPCGHATVSGSHEDWLIPSGMLGANVSGLISRSILNAQIIGPRDFHGAMPVRHLADIDFSRDFVDRVTPLMLAALGGGVERVCAPCAASRKHLRDRSEACVQAIAYREGVQTAHRIKPGITEATRAILRRRPRKVFLRDLKDPNLAAIVHLCRTDGVEIEVDADITGPYRAITLIEKVT